MTAFSVFNVEEAGKDQAANPRQGSQNCGAAVHISHHRAAVAMSTDSGGTFLATSSDHFCRTTSIRRNTFVRIRTASSKSRAPDLYHRLNGVRLAGRTFDSLEFSFSAEAFKFAQKIGEA